MNLSKFPLVSLIIPTYKRRDFFAAALDSVFAQTFKDFEVIVVEDGSHVAEKQIKRLGDSVQYVWQPNRGVAEARNTGARVARGQWLAFLDDDDLWLPKKLELQVSLATLSPEAGVIHTDYYVLRNADLELGSRRGFQRAVPSGWVAEPLFLDNFILTSSVLIRKDVFGRSGGFDQRFSPAEDYHLWIRVSRECPIAYVSEPLTIYRDHEEGISSSQMISRIRAAEVLENIALNIPSIWKEFGRLTVRRRLSEARWAAAYSHFLAELYTKATKEFFTAWRWEPWNLKAFAYGCACLGGFTGVKVLRDLKRALLGPKEVRS